MKKIVTQGDICLQGDYDFVYKVTEITYTLWEDENRKQYHDLLKPFSHYNCKQIYNKIFALAFLLYKKRYIDKNEEFIFFLYSTNIKPENCNKDI